MVGRDFKRLCRSLFRSYQLVVGLILRIHSCVPMNWQLMCDYYRSVWLHIKKDPPKLYEKNHNFQNHILGKHCGNMLFKDSMGIYSPAKQVTTPDYLIFINQV